MGEKRGKVTGIRIGQYQLGETIGKGGFGCVYRALDQQAGHQVAIKQVSLGGLHSGDISNIEVEIDLLSKLKHKNIVKYIHSIRTETHLNIVLEFVEGGSIAGILKKFGAFPESLCAIYTLQILKGLKFLHSQGVIHRDIKGANVLSTKTGTIKLADFGVATQLSEIESSKRRVVGTPYWMAPETVEIGPPTAASDIWSVGSTVVEMVTKNPPYAELHQLTALYRIVSDPHPPLPEGFSEELNSFLLKCFEKSSVDRPGAAALLDDPWIQGNKRWHLEIRGQMLTPKVQAKADDEESDSAEELDQLTNTLQESLLTQLRSKENSPKAKAKAREAVRKFSPKSSRTLDISPSNSNRSDQVTSKKLLEVLPASYQESHPRNSEELAGYHYFFLDYYRHNCELKPEDPHSSDLPSQAEREEDISKRTMSTITTPLREDEPPPLDREQQRMASEVKNLLGRIRPFEEVDELFKVCKKLRELLAQGRTWENKENVRHLVMQHGAVPIVEMLQVQDSRLQDMVLKVVNQIVADGNPDFQEIFNMVGLIKEVIKFANTDYHRSLRVEVGRFISHLCASDSLQMLVACGGLGAMVELISSDYSQNRDLVGPALEHVETVLNKQGNHSKDLCRILAKQGLCEHLVLLIDTLASDMGPNSERAAHYLQLVINMLVFFANKGDAVVKAYMSKVTVLEGLIASLEFLPQELVLEICKIFTELTQEPSVLNMMENSGLVPVMVHYMSAPGEPGQQDVCDQCLLALTNLCKLSRPRQEQAALAGAIPKLQAIVERQHPLRKDAFSMLCDMTSTSLATRKELWNLGSASFLVRYLGHSEMQVPALEALVGWFAVKEHQANWCLRLEGLLLKGPDFLLKLLNIFKCQESSIFLKVLEPLLKLVTCSQETNTALAASDEFLSELLRRLETQESTGRHFNRFNSMGPSNNFTMEDPKASPVRRFTSQPDTDDAVRARKSLLGLLMQLCQNLSKEQLALLVLRFRLKQQLQWVLAEEKRRNRVILIAIATQLLELFQSVSPDEAFA